MNQGKEEKQITREADKSACRVQMDLPRMGDSNPMRHTSGRITMSPARKRTNRTSKAGSVWPRILTSDAMTISRNPPTTTKQAPRILAGIRPHTASGPLNDDFRLDNDSGRGSGRSDFSGMKGGALSSVGCEVTGSAICPRRPPIVKWDAAEQTYRSLSARPKI